MQEFFDEWQPETENTTRVFAQLTDAALDQKVTAEGRTLRTLAWHIVCSISQLTARLGFDLEGPSEDAAEPDSADGIRGGYAQLTASLNRQLQDRWTDDALKTENDMFGELWTNGKTLGVMLIHQVHHRAQMTVLMRQAGLRVPGIYGPSREEWSAYGRPPLR